MKLTIDLSTGLVQVRKDLESAVRFALGAEFYIEQADAANFTKAELADPAINVPSVSPTTPSLAPVPQEPGTLQASVPPTGTVELDSQGLPYDPRIHSAGKTKIADGTWKLKKGVDKAEVERINSANRQLVGNSAPLKPLAIAGDVHGEMPNTVTLPALPALDPVASLPPINAEIVVTDYASFAQYIAQQVASPKGEKAKELLDHGLTHYGIVNAEKQADMHGLAHRPEVVDPLYKWLKINLAAA